MSSAKDYASSHEMYPDDVFVCGQPPLLEPTLSRMCKSNSSQTSVIDDGADYFRRLLANFT